MPDDLRENTADICMRGLHCLMAGAEEPGHLALPGAFVELVVSKSNRECVKTVVGVIAYDGANNGRIQSSAQVGPDWDVSSQTDLSSID